jgi:hypothetical protein
MQWSHASYIYIKVLEGFSTCCHEVLLLMQVTELDILWKMFVLVDRSLWQPVKNTSFQWYYYVWAEQGGSRETGLSLLQGGHWFETLEGYAANSPCYCVQLQVVCAVDVRVTCEPNYGVYCGEIDNQWGCFSLYIVVEPPFNVLFQLPQVSILSAKFPPFKIFIALMSKCTSPRGNLKYGFHSHQIHIYLNFIVLVVCNPDVSRVCYVKTNFSKNNPSLHIRCTVTLDLTD